MLDSLRAYVHECVYMHANVSTGKSFKGNKRSDIFFTLYLFSVNCVNDYPEVTSNHPP